MPVDPREEDALNASRRLVVLLTAVMAGALACSMAPTPVLPTPVPPTPAPTSVAVVATPAPTAAAPPPSATPTPSLAQDGGPITTLGTTRIATLDTPYDTSRAVFDPARLDGLKPGVVKVQWFWGEHGSSLVDGTYLVMFVGLDSNASLCLGTGIRIGAARDHVSRAARGAGGCIGDVSDPADADRGVFACAHDLTFFATAIPDGATGTLEAWVEKVQPDGSIVGIAGSVKTFGAPRALDVADPRLGCTKAGR